MVTSKRTTELLRSLIALKPDAVPDITGNGEVPSVVTENARLLKLLVMSQKPKKILEIGTAAGFSAVLMAQTAPEATVYTIEGYEKNYLTATDNIKRLGLEKRIHIFYGDAGDVIEKMNADHMDFIFLDGPKSHYVTYLPRLIEMLSPGGMLVCDNVLFRGMIAGDKKPTRRKETIIGKLHAFLEAVSAAPELTTSVLPIGDGISVSIKETI